MINKFYVYEWYNIITNEVFYVGKGCGNRYKDKIHRNNLFLQYIKNNPEVQVRIIASDLSEQEAFIKEEKLISYYRKLGQCSCNFAQGGYGGKATVWTEEMKKYWSENNPMKDEIQRQRMRDKNPMKDPLVSKKVGISHKKPVIINDIVFPGVEEAANFYNVSGGTIRNWCKAGFNPDKTLKCCYQNQQDNNNNKISKKIPIKINDIYFPSVRQAAIYFNLNETEYKTLLKCLKLNKNYLNYKCEYVNQQPSQ